MFIGTSYRRGFLTVLLGLASTVVPGTIASANYISYEYIADLGSGTSVPQFSLSPAYATLFSVTLSITSIADVVGYSEWENDSQVSGHATINILPNVTSFH